jgi:hypothetical protein
MDAPRSGPATLREDRQEWNGEPAADRIRAFLECQKPVDMISIALL